MPGKSSKKPIEKKEEKKTPLKRLKGKTVKQLRDIHLKDKSHVITTEEIKDLDLELNNPDASTSHTPEILNDTERPKDEEKDEKMITPWDVIDQ